MNVTRGIHNTQRNRNPHLTQFLISLFSLSTIFFCFEFVHLLSLSWAVAYCVEWKMPTKGFFLPANGKLSFNCLSICRTFRLHCDVSVINGLLIYVHLWNIYSSLLQITNHSLNRGLFMSDVGTVSVRVDLTDFIY